MAISNLKHTGLCHRFSRELVVKGGNLNAFFLPLQAQHAYFLTGSLGMRAFEFHNDFVLCDDHNSRYSGTSVQLEYDN